MASLMIVTNDYFLPLPALQYVDPDMRRYTFFLSSKQFDTHGLAIESILPITAVVAVFVLLLGHCANHCFTTNG